MSALTATESFHPRGQVDLSTVRLVHARLFARYGSAWRAKYAGLEVETVEKDWFHELQLASTWAVDYALNNLPLDFPPTAGQFREICRRAPARPVPPAARLPPPKADPARLTAELRRLHAMLKDRGPRQWAFDLQAREQAGEHLSEVQRRKWREALATTEATLSGQSYEFQQEELPPGMRTKKVDPADVAKLEEHVRKKLYAKREAAGPRA